jgi:hypothetical protein
MFRKLICAAVGVLVAAAVSWAAPEKRPPAFTTPQKGKVKKVDADKGTLTVTVTEKGKDKDVELKVGRSTRFMAFGAKGGPPVTVEGKAGLKSKALKKGAEVRFMVDDEGNARMVITGQVPSFPGAGAGGRPGPGGGVRPLPPSFVQGGGSYGKVKNIDAEKGVLTLTVQEKGEAKDRKLKVSKNTRFIVGGKVVTGTDGLKSLKKGQTIGFQADKEDHLKMVMMMFARQPFGGPSPYGEMGRLKKVDDEKGVLVVTVGKETVELKIGKGTKVICYSASGPKTFEGKDTIKKAKKHLKTGKGVRFFKAKDGTVKQVSIFEGGYGQNPRRPTLKPRKPTTGDNSKKDAKEKAKDKEQSSEKETKKKDKEEKDKDKQ